MTKERLNAINKLERIIEGKKINEEQKQMLTEGTTRGEIEEAIKNTANGTSPGIDSIPYELYKMIMEKEKKKEEGVGGGNTTCSCE